MRKSSHIGSQKGDGGPVPRLGSDRQQVRVFKSEESIFYSAKQMETNTQLDPVEMF